MKLKQILLFTLCITFFACNTESIDTPTPNEVSTNDMLVKKISYKFDNEQFVENYIYDKNKIKSINSSNGYKTEYTYSNDKIIRIDNFENEELIAYTTLAYDSENRLESYIDYFDMPGDSSVWKSVFSYNTDGTITKTIYMGDSNSQTNLSDTYTYILQEENIIKYASDYQVVSFEYDNKNGVYKNIYDINVINLLNLDLGALEGNKNNISKATEELGNGNITSETFDYTYNDKNYPIKAIYERIDKIDNGQVVEKGSLEYFYE